MKRFLLLYILLASSYVYASMHKTIYNVSVGSLFTVSADQAGREHFNRKPAIYIKDSGKRVSAQVLTKKFPCKQVLCKWKKLFGSGVRSLYLKTSKGNETTVSDCFKFIRPVINSINKNSPLPGDNVYIEGIGFGNKRKIKAYCAYTLNQTGIEKKKRCKVKTINIEDGIYQIEIGLNKKIPTDVSFDVVIKSENGLAVQPVNIGNELPRYYNLLKNLKDRGFVFWNFKTYYNSDKENLPENLIVIRHDIHYRDIKYAYSCYEIENRLIGPDIATYYVMYNFPDEVGIKALERQYVNFINYIKGKSDVDPHISPVDMYFSIYSPAFMSKNVTDLKLIFENSYTIKKLSDGIEIVQKGNEDPLNLTHLFQELPQLLERYNNQWKTKFGLDVFSYAGHGTGHKFQNILNNFQILDDRSLKKLGIYKFDTYNTEIMNKLNYLSDNYMPAWMDNPDLIKPGRYQFLMHPGIWH